MRSRLEEMIMGQGSNRQELLQRNNRRGEPIVGMGFEPTAF
jgi:hypothetical protein